ncbi:hypothetical protein HK097_003664, partial [Rhizophlyctis rosea]
MLHVFKRIRCHVYVDGKELEEYNVETKGHHIQCYIIGEEGKEYIVKVYNDAYKNTDENSLIAQLYVDGSSKLMGSVIEYGRSTLLDGKRDYWGNIHSLVFGRLNTTSTDASKPPSIPDLSTISVVVKQVAITRRTPMAAEYPHRALGRSRFANVESESAAVDERAPKQSKVLRDMVTRFGKAIADDTKNSTFVSTAPISEPNASGELLEASGIIPVEIASAADDELLLKDVKQEGEHNPALRRSSRLRPKIVGGEQPDSDAEEEDSPLPAPRRSSRLDPDTQMSDPSTCNDKQEANLPTSPMKKRTHIDMRSSSSTSTEEEDNTLQKEPSRPVRKSRRTSKPTEGVLIDLEADGGPVETRFAIEQKDVEVVDLIENGGGGA